MTTRADRDASLLSRRRLVLGAASVGLLLGCGDDRSGIRPGAGGGGGASGGGVGGAAAGELLEVLPFVDDGDLPLETPLGVGWDGRLYTDLARLDRDALVTPNDRFYIRTRYPDLLDPAAPWAVTVDGLVEETAILSLDDLLPLASPRGSTSSSARATAAAARSG